MFLQILLLLFNVSVEQVKSVKLCPFMEAGLEYLISLLNVVHSLMNDDIPKLPLASNYSAIQRDM